jgi:hypothetical protein
MRSLSNGAGAAAGRGREGAAAGFSATCVSAVAVRTGAGVAARAGAGVAAGRVVRLARRTTGAGAGAVAAGA